MRNIVTKTAAVALVVGAALAVSACGKTETTNVTENASMTDINAEGSMSDASAADLNDTNLTDANAVATDTNSMADSSASNAE